MCMCAVINELLQLMLFINGFPDQTWKIKKKKTQRLFRKTQGLIRQIQRKLQQTKRLIKLISKKK